MRASLAGRWFLVTGGAIPEPGVVVPWHVTFGEVAAGEPLLYEDADYGGLGIAVNQGSAAERFRAPDRCADPHRGPRGVTDPGSTPIVAIDGLTFRYRRASEPAIRDVSLDVSPGEVVLVAGPSGCGKSTLIRAINGLIPHAYSGELSGSILVDGQDTRELRLRDLARTVGTVLQDPAKQIVGATVEAELAFGPENFGIPREEIRERIREVAEQAGIQRLLGRETSALSGGERQLLAVAGILMLRPRLFVVDEPLANLDPATAERLLALLRSLADEGSAIVIVEHRVEESLDLRPDRVLYLETGSTRYIGPVDGFLEVADPESVKLPFEVVVRRIAETSPDDTPPTAPEPPPVTPTQLPEEEDERPPRLEFRDVTASIMDTEILLGVDARLGATETVAVLGPNGSGKTTLFRTAMRLLDISGGAVLVDGRTIADRRTTDLVETFGYVFQSPSQMLFARTVEEELLFGPTQARARSRDIRGAGRGRVAADVARRPRRRARAAAARDVVRPAEAPRAGHRPGPPAGDAHPRRAVSGTGSPDGPRVHARGRGHPRPGESVLRHARRGPCIDACRPYPPVSGRSGDRRRSPDGRDRRHGALEGVRSASDLADGGEHTVRREGWEVPRC